MAGFSRLSSVALLSWDTFTEVCAKMGLATVMTENPWRKGVRRHDDSHCGRIIPVMMNKSDSPFALHCLDDVLYCYGSALHERLLFRLLHRSGDGG